MRSALALTCVLLGGCGAAPPPARTVASPSSPTGASSSSRPAAAAPAVADAPGGAPAASAAVDLERWRRRPVSSDCRRALTALAAGALDDFHGLGHCGRVDAEGTLGDSGAGLSQFEKMGEYRVFAHASRSVIAYFLGDEIRVVELLYPTLERPLLSLLGPPETTARSELSPGWEQRIYASRGLTAHVNRATGEVVALFAYRPTSVDAYLKSDLAHVSKSEAPLEQLK
jgi:hypothetical protein